MTNDDTLSGQIAATLHTLMPGCTHDEHGSDCKALSDAVTPIVSTRCTSVENERSSREREADRLRKDWVDLRNEAEQAQAEAAALWDKLKKARDLHRQSCPLARGQVSPPAFACELCEAFDEPLVNRTSGHLVACQGAVRGPIDPECPCRAEHPWLYRVTAHPGDGRPPQSQYYPTARQARFWRDEVKATGYRTTVARIPAEAFEALSEDGLDRLAQRDHDRAT